jgi:hypothetical protein
MTGEVQLQRDTLRIKTVEGETFGAGETHLASRHLLVVGLEIETHLTLKQSVNQQAKTVTIARAASRSGFSSHIGVIEAGSNM